MSRIITYNEVKEFVEGKDGNGCMLLSEEYTGNSAKMMFKCKCGNKFETSYAKFKGRNKKQCNECGYGTNRKVYKHTFDEVKKYIEVDSESECILVSKTYSSSLGDIIIKCKCGNEFTTTYNSFKWENKRQCDSCTYGCRKKCTETFKQQVFRRHGDEYEVLGEYTRSNENILIKHKHCGSEYYMRADNVIKSPKCAYCHGHMPKTKTQIERTIMDLVGNEYELHNESAISGVVKLIHSECGYHWNVNISNFLQGQRCPNCRVSKGEKTTIEVLRSAKVEYIHEHSFDDLVGVGGGLLRFDFAILNENKNIGFLLECDGEFHYTKMYEAHDFESQQIHDKRKNQYCKDNDIPLLRIPYWEFDNIEKILYKWLSKYELIHSEKIEGIT